MIVGFTNVASFFKKRILVNEDIAPDEIFLDDRNMPGFDQQQFEGRIERPLARSSLYFLGGLFGFIVIVFWWKLGDMQVNHGADYAAQSTRNRIDETYIFPERGVISDRNGVPLAWNLPKEGDDADFAKRKYIDEEGFGHVLGYLGYPLKDKNGLYYQEAYTAINGIESQYHQILSGAIGKHLVEVDARGKVVWSNTVIPPVSGKNLTLSIDADLQHQLFETISGVARAGNWTAGAGAIIDINNGELLALTSFPEFSSNVMTERDDPAKIAEYHNDKRSPFIDRAVTGLFAPGSIVKPLIATAALQEKVITKNTIIVSEGRITVPNKYFPDKPTHFNDWRAQGPMTVKEGIAYSSDVFFYEVGGGFGSQKGLGIDRLEKWYRNFSYGAPTGIDLEGEASGTLPNPAWKEKHFGGDPWRIGDTYFTSIGQYGVQATLLQPLVEAAAIANKGTILTPHLLKDQEFPKRTLPVDQKNFEIVQEGMRMSASPIGTANVLVMDGVHFGAKTGTAELGVTKNHVNSWVIGFFPYEKPKYAFALVMEHGTKGDTKNAAYTMRKFFDWLASTHPQYLDMKTPIATTTETVSGHDGEADAPIPVPVTNQ